MAIIRTSNLGWKAGQDVSKQFGTLVRTLDSGDTLIVDDMYKVSGSYKLPNNIVIAGGSEGAGFDVRDVVANRDPFLKIGDDTTLRDITISHDNTPASGRLFKRTIEARGDDIKILNSKFEGRTDIFIDASGERMLVQDTEFDGANYQMRWLSSKDFVVDNTLFTNAESDGIKTLASDKGSQKTTIVDSVFLNNGRDGIDTTGGFKDSVVVDSYFVNNFAGLDIKTIYDKNFPTFREELTNTNIKITGSEFINNQNHLVFTTLDRANALTTSNAKKLAVNDFLVSDSVFESFGKTANVFLVKDSHDIHWDNIEVRGGTNMVRNIDAYKVGLPTNVNGKDLVEAGTRSSTDRSDNYSSYADIAGNDWSKAKYFGESEPNPEPEVPEIVVETPPVVEETPEPAPTPIKPTPPAQEKPAPKPAPKPEPKPEPIKATPGDADGSSLLKVYLADTRNEKTFLQLEDGATIDSSILPFKNTTFYAESIGSTKIGSVKIEVEGVKTAIENVAPYALFGDSGTGNFYGGTKLPVGDHKVILTVYEGRKATGKVLETSELKFTVEDTSGTVSPPKPAPTPQPKPAPVVDKTGDEVEQPVKVDAPDSILDIRLAYTDSDRDVAELTDGTLVDVSDTNGRSLTVYAVAEEGAPKIGSVRLELDGKDVRLENAAPYAVFGDNGKGDFFGGRKLAAGEHTIELTVYSGAGGSGKILEKTSLDFNIGSTSQKLQTSAAQTQMVEDVMSIQLATTMSVGEAILTESLLMANGNAPLDFNAPGVEQIVLSNAEQFVQQGDGSANGTMDFDFI